MWRLACHLEPFLLLDGLVDAPGERHEPAAQLVDVVLTLQPRRLRLGALEPSLADGLFTSTREAIDELERKEMPAVLVVSPTIRAWLSKLLRRVTKDLTVLSYVEIPDDQPISVTSTISIKREEATNAGQQ